MRTKDDVSLGGVYVCELYKSKTVFIQLVSLNTKRLSFAQNNSCYSVGENCVPITDCVPSPIISQYHAVINQALVLPRGAFFPFSWHIGDLLVG